MKRAECECCGKEFLTADDDTDLLCDPCWRHQDYEDSR